MEKQALAEPFEEYLARHPEITPVQAEYLKPVMERAAYEEYAFIVSYLFM